MSALSFLSSTMERALQAVARTSTGGKPTEMGVRYLSKNYAIELSHLHILATSLVCFEYRRRLSRSHPLSGGISLPLLLPAVPQRRRASLPATVSRPAER